MLKSTIIIEEMKLNEDLTWGESAYLNKVDFIHKIKDHPLSVLFRKEDKVMTAVFFYDKEFVKKQNKKTKMKDYLLKHILNEDLKSNEKNLYIEDYTFEHLIDFFNWKDKIALSVDLILEEDVFIDLELSIFLKLTEYLNIEESTIKEFYLENRENLHKLSKTEYNDFKLALENQDINNKKDILDLFDLNFKH